MTADTSSGPAVVANPPLAARQPGRWRPAATTVRSAFAVVGVLLAWELLGRTLFDGSHLLAAPTAIAERIGDSTGLYWRATKVTVREAAWGFLWGNLAAVALAALVAAVPVLERLVLRVALVVFCLPLVATGPVLRVVFGMGDGPQITLAALAVYYTTLVPLVVGLRAVPAVWLDLVSSYGRGRWTALVRVRARASLPYLATGLQVGVPAAFLGALVGEFTGAERGLGIVVIQELRDLDTAGVWAIAVISSAVSVGGYVLAGALVRLLVPDAPPVILAAPADAGAPGRGPLRALRVFAEIGLATLVVLVLWEAGLRYFDLDPYFAKSPADVWAWLVTDPAAAANREEILDALGNTAHVTIPGYFAGLLLGAVLAVVFDLSAAIRRVATPFAVALRCVPIVAVAPLLVQAFGRGAVGTTVIVGLMTFFPTLVACSQGLRLAPGQVVDLFRSYDVGPVRTLLLARAPAMLPAFFAAARIAVPAAVLAATVAEWLATGTGMGNLMALSANNSGYGTLWAAVVVVTLIAVGGYAVVTFVERIVLSRVAPEQAAW